MANKVKSPKSNNMKTKSKNISESALNLSEKLVEGSLATGAKWQEISAKLLKEGTVIFGKQQELALCTLEELKGQMIKGNKRLMNLFGLDLPKLKKEAKAVKSEIKEKINQSAPVKKAKRSVKQVVKMEAVVGKDDLRKIDGVGPKIATLLNQAGITTFDQLAAADIKELNAILEAAGPRYNMHDPKTWVIQAKRMIK